jgi:hypothetical protein
VKVRGGEPEKEVPDFLRRHKFFSTTCGTCEGFSGIASIKGRVLLFTKFKQQTIN